jgi:DNA recombination-dependent growth factor C
MNEVLKDCEFNSSDEIGDAITNVWDELTSNEVHSVFRNGLGRLACVIQNGGECIIG